MYKKYICLVTLQAIYLKKKTYQKIASSFGKKKAITSNRFLERNEKKLPKISTFLNFAVIMKDVSI